MVSAPSSPRQTLGYLRALLEARGLRPKSKLGQSFLIDLNLLDLIVRTAELSREDLAFEVGAGTASLTARLAELAGAVLAVEIDLGFFELAGDATSAFDNVHLVQADILKSKNQINPDIVARLTAMRSAPGIRCTKLVANLPYVVATPVITNLLLGDIEFERMVAMVQWELAERLAARSSTKDYSAASVTVQSLAEVEIVRRIPPAVFWPRPRVDSAIVLIRPDPARRAAIRDLPAFHAFVRDLYLHRRKNLRGALFPIVRDRFTKPDLDRQLTRSGFDPYGRAEALSVADHLRLFETLYSP